MSNNELLEALNILEQEKNISKDTLLEAIENSLVTACKNHFGSSDNVKVSIDPETCEFHVFQEKTVVETVEDPVEQISLVNAKMINSKYEIGDVVNIEVQSKEFGRIATQNAKNLILQKIREEERKVVFDQYFAKEIDGRLWLNPGSCGRSRFGGDVTMAVMTVENGSWQVEKIVL